ncbi:hypothetical protein DES53_10663 [Roseimicrobium gellanilyticum]|uniref:Lipoprotein n=1 Tax=Roseimicrobium gellanilyticum TaxID=748857 RepID=A0A366HK26_9BACT|nr:hypothetical protein [Roseimicrobium gellanilyticum]RBP42359.1 hypothetical protein DES53_10663 [Roseimicrobium gellanilyticum]
MRAFVLLILAAVLTACSSTKRHADLNQREAQYKQTLGVLGKGATRAQLDRAFPKMRRITPEHGPGDDSALTGVERFRLDPYHQLEVKFMYAAPYRIAAGATRLGAQKAAGEGPSAWEIFKYVRETSRGAYAESPYDEVISARVLRVSSY